jgi:stage V sporulation protein B
VALPLALADNVKAGLNTTENLMVPKRLALYPGTDTPLAQFGMVCGMVFPVLMFPAAILFALAELLIPELARCAAADSRVRIDYLVRRSLRLAMLYGCFCGGLLYLLAKPLCLSLYQNVEAGQYLKLYAFLAPMLYCDAITDAMTKGLGQQKICVRYNILTSTMDVVFLFLLLPQYGMKGYFFSFFVTHLLNFCLSMGRLLKITSVKIPFYIPALTISATLAAALGASLLQNISMRIGAYLALLFSLLTLFRVISRGDILWIKGLLTQK